MKAIWNGEIIAESNDTVVVEGNHYFPKDSLRANFFSPSDQKSHCPWKGDASYHDVDVNGSKNPGAAWFYPTPKPAASELADHVAFWKGVEVTE